MAKLSKQFSDELITRFVEEQRDDIFQHFVYALTNFKGSVERGHLDDVLSTLRSPYVSPIAPSFAIPVPPSRTAQYPWSPTIFANTSQAVKSKIGEIEPKIKELMLSCVEMLALLESEQGETKPSGKENENCQVWIKPRYAAPGDYMFTRDIEPSQAGDTGVVDNADHG